jgi:arsenate reductase
LTVTIFHNPDCGTSRNTLALIRRAGIEPTVIEYLKTPPDHDTLKELFGRAGLLVRDAARRKGTPSVALGLADPAIADEAILDAMMAYPILINRPIVVSAKGVKLCRPSDIVLDLLPPMPKENVRKDDGEQVLAGREVDGSDAGLRAALEAAALPVDDLSDPGRRFFAYGTLDGTPVGYGGYEPLGDEALLRSLVVPPIHRGSGIGRAILAILQRRCFDDGARRSWVLTIDAAAYFERQGFNRAERQNAPDAVLATRQATSLCPATATLLTRNIEL